MFKINKISDKVIEFVTTNAQGKVISTSRKFANFNLDVVDREGDLQVSLSNGFNTISIPAKELIIDGAAAPLSVAALTAALEFIGSFKSGGGGVSPEILATPVIMAADSERFKIVQIVVTNFGMLQPVIGQVVHLENGVTFTISTLVLGDPQKFPTTDIFNTDVAGEGIPDANGKGLTATVKTVYAAGNIITLGELGNTHITDPIVQRSYVDKAINDVVRPENLVYDVTRMLTLSDNNVDIIAHLYKRFNSNGKELIKISGNNGLTSGLNLTITPAFQFGANYSEWKVERTTENGSTFVDNAIQIIGETTSAQSQILIPATCKRYSFDYFVGANDTGIIASYYIDTVNVYHPFELSNTTLANLSNNQGTTTGDVTINGIVVKKLDIKHITFGSSYNAATIIPASFLYNVANLSSINLIGLKNIVNIQGEILMNTAIQVLDLSNFRNLNGTFSVFQNPSFNIVSLKKIIIGDIDWTSIVVDANSFSKVPNTSDRIIEGKSLNLINIFKSKFPNVSGYTAVVV